MNYEAKANKIDYNKRQQIIMHLDRVLENTYKPSSDSLQFLLTNFNKYINSTPSDISCGDCMRAIIKFWKQMKKIWT